MVSTPSKSPAVTYAAAILRYLADQPRPPGLTTIARAVGASPSSCLNILRTLVTEGLVAFDETDKTYSIGSAVIILARRALNPDNTMAVARDVLHKLAKDYDVTAALWRVTHDQRLIIAGFEMSETDMRLHMTVGQRVPLLAGAAGRSVTASSSIPPDRLLTLFKKMRWDAAPTFEEYLEEIESARLKGWALDRGEFKRGVISLGAAICDEEDKPRLSVSASLLGGHHDEARLEKIGQATVAVAKRIRQMIYGISAT